MFSDRNHSTHSDIKKTLLTAKADEMIFVPVMQTSVSHGVSSLQYSCTHCSFQTGTLSLLFLIAFPQFILITRLLSSIG